MLRRLSFILWYFGRPPLDSGISPPELLDFIAHQPPGHAIDLGCGTGTNVVRPGQGRLAGDRNRFCAARDSNVSSPITKFVEDATRFYMEFHDEFQSIEGCVINDPLALALTFAPELCTYREMPVDVDISGGISMGKTIGDFYNYGKQPANMRVALDVKPRDFIDLFVERISKFAESVRH